MFRHKYWNGTPFSTTFFLSNPFPYKIIFSTINDKIKDVFTFPIAKNKEIYFKIFFTSWAKISTINITFDSLFCWWKFSLLVKCDIAKWWFLESNFMIIISKLMSSTFIFAANIYIWQMWSWVWDKILTITISLMLILSKIFNSNKPTMLGRRTVFLIENNYLLLTS